MSFQTTGRQTNNQLTVNTDVSKIFIKDNRTQKGNVAGNSNYSTLSLPAGTLMGRVATTNLLGPCYPSGLDGTQFPTGVLMRDVSLAPGEQKEVTICDFGDVVADKITFFYGGTLDSIVSSRRIKDYLQAQGIKLITATEQTHTDNQ